MKQLTLYFKEGIGQLLKPARPAKDTENGVLTQADGLFFWRRSGQPSAGGPRNWPPASCRRKD